MGALVREGGPTTHEVVVVAPLPPGNRFNYSRANKRLIE